MQHLHIEVNPTTITAKTVDGQVVWQRGAPSVAEWQGGWAPPDIAQRLRNGQYQYLNGETTDTLTVVFTPWGGLDHNLAICKATGSILSAPSEAR